MGFIQHRSVSRGFLILAVILLFLLVIINLRMRSATEFPDGKNKVRQYRKLTSQAAHIFVNSKGEMVIPEADVLDTLDAVNLQEMYHRYIESIQVRCRRQVHIGNEFDGGYHVCEDAEVVPVPPCLVYSFGIRRDFSFDDGISQAYGCEVHSFDPGDGQVDHKHSENVTFHKLGISGHNTNTTSGWKLRTLGTIRKDLGHEKRHIDVVKIDTEGAEWSSLSEMVRNGSITDVRQLLVEFHVFVKFNVHLNLTSEKDYKAHLNLFRDLYELGLRIYFFRMWNNSPGHLTFKNEDGIVRTGCHEVHFMKVYH